MPDAATIASLRAQRDGARTRFHDGLLQLKSDTGMGSVGARIIGKVQSDAEAAGTYVLDVIEDNKGVVGGTLAALGVWFFRAPLIAWIEAHFGNPETPEGAKAEFKDTTDE